MKSMLALLILSSITVHSLRVVSPPTRNFTALGIKCGTDKVGLGYGPFYNKHLGHLQDAPIKFMEIGFANGNGADTWEAFLPNAKILEFEIACNPKEIDSHREWMQSGRLKCGNALNWSFISPILAEFGTPDVVVDDAGHGATEMKANFLSLFPRVQSNGFFFMEDLKESYAGGADNEDGEQGFIQAVLRPLMDDLHLLNSGGHGADYRPSIPGHHTSKFPEILARLRSISCQEQICAFERNDEPPVVHSDQFVSEYHLEGGMKMLEGMYELYFGDTAKGIVSQ